MPARRIVTANDADGKSYFQHDGPTPGVVDLGAFLNEEIWVDDPTSSKISAETDPAAAEAFDLEPPPGGSRVRVFTFRPNDGTAYDPEIARIGFALQHRASNGGQATRYAHHANN